MGRKPGRMATLSKKTVDKTDAELSDEEFAILRLTTIDWEAIRPQVSDTLLYDKLLSHVQEATENNEKLSQFKARIETLGTEGVKLTSKVIGLIKELV